MVFLLVPSSEMTLLREDEFRVVESRNLPSSSFLNEGYCRFLMENEVTTVNCGRNCQWSVEILPLPGLNDDSVPNPVITLAGFKVTIS